VRDSTVASDRDLDHRAQGAHGRSPPVARRRREGLTQPPLGWVVEIADARVVPAVLVAQRREQAQPSTPCTPESTSTARAGCAAPSHAMSIASASPPGPRPSTGSVSQSAAAPAAALKKRARAAE